MRRTLGSTLGNTMGNAWAATAHLVVGVPVVILASSLIQSVGLLALIAAAVVWPIARPARNAVFEVAHLCSQLQRFRFRHLLGVRITPAGPDNVAAGWRQVLYHLVVAQLIVVFSAALLLSMWTVSLACVLYPMLLTPETSPFGLWLWYPSTHVALALLSAGLAAGAILLAPPLAYLDAYATRRLIQLSRAEQLALRVEALSHSRAEVVGAADAERRRIERDLHDGAQQRLVSLAMNLGMARVGMSDADPETRRVIEDAHDEAKLALAELRELVRGLHPAVLHDRGLDAALSGIAARSPVPARLKVELDGRPSPAVEAVAYFVVAEALSNVAKHSRAGTVWITARGRADRLHLEIRDDGVGGANPSLGTGLRGLAQRVSSVDGSWHVSSPSGGPTVITVELPCES